MIKRIILIVAAWLIVCGVPLRPAAAGALSPGKKLIRVAVLQDVSHFTLKVKGAYEVTDLSGRKSFFRGRDLKTTVSLYPSGIMLKGRSFKADRIFIEAGSTDDAIVIGGRKFRGRIQLIKKSNGRLLVVNYIELEDYIRGILYHEISHYWPMEAIKTQAIVSRTFALFLMEQNKARDFDATNDIYSQVYGGKTSERYRTNNAVDETRGQVLIYKDTILPAFFHATCAGHTEDAAVLWGIEVSPLKGVTCNYCSGSPHYKWHFVLSLEEFSDKLKAAGYKIGVISNVSVAARNQSGRVVDLTITTDTGEIKVPAKDFRIAVSPNLIRSTNFIVSVAGRDAVFEGVGWGHGVGLCQWGAYFMAKQGKTTQEILSFYYPGTDVKTLKF